MTELYSNMLKLDYWTLQFGLNTIVTYGLMKESHTSMESYQEDEVDRYQTVKRRLLNKICKDKFFVDKPEEIEPEYDRNVLFEDNPDLTDADLLHFGKSKISPKKFISWCLEERISVNRH